MAVAQLFEKLNNIESLLFTQRQQTHLSDADCLLNMEEAAELLNLSKPTIYGLVQRKAIPCMKRGNRLYFSKTELISWVKEGRKKTSAEIELEAEMHLNQLKKGGKK